ncbi:MAG: hypothetical protein QNI90_07190 [Dinoroseobacter sp.]|nr:hypothetical protein [Dinoroseobacter sp.]
MITWPLYRASERCGRFPTPASSGKIDAFREGILSRLPETTRIDHAGLTYGWIGSMAYVQLDNMEPEVGFVRGPQQSAREALAKTHSAATGIIIEMRWNEGGSERAALGIAGLFAASPWSFGTTITRTAPGVFAAAADKSHPGRCRVIQALPSLTLKEGGNCQKW